MTPITAKPISLKDILTSIHTDNKIPFVIINEEMYCHAKDSLYLRNCLESHFDGYPKTLPINQINNPIIYALPSTKTPYQTVKANQCLDKYLYKQEEGGIHDEVRKCLKEGKIVGCMYEAGSAKRLIDNKEEVCFDKYGKKQDPFYRTAYTKFCYFDDMIEALKWIMS